MTQEEKQLLLVDLCARLPYRTFVQTYHYNTGSFEPLMPRLLEAFIKDEGLEIKPYLRPMSSMTDEEQLEYSTFGFTITDHINADRVICPKYTVIETKEVYAISFIIDWLNKHHFDYRGLIPMGLALEAPEGMYDN